LKLERGKLANVLVAGSALSDERAVKNLGEILRLAQDDSTRPMRL